MRNSMIVGIALLVLALANPLRAQNGTFWCGGGGGCAFGIAPQAAGDLVLSQDTTEWIGWTDGTDYGDEYVVALCAFADTIAWYPYSEYSPEDFDCQYFTVNATGVCSIHTKCDWGRYGNIAEFLMCDPEDSSVGVLTFPNTLPYVDDSCPGVMSHFWNT